MGIGTQGETEVWYLWSVTIIHNSCC